MVLETSEKIRRLSARCNVSVVSYRTFVSWKIIRSAPRLSSRTLVFLMDPLCVPLGMKCRKLAIRGMASTYQNCMQALVFDSELKRVTYPGKPSHELFARIESSGWMRRVWTLQESVLASRFSDGIMEVSSAVRRM